MSQPSPPRYSTAFIEQQIAIYETARRTSTLVVDAPAVLLLYDVLLTLGQEWQYIWRSPKSWLSRLLYLWNRYMPLLGHLLDLGRNRPMPDANCSTLVWLTYAVKVLGIIGPAAFTTLRIYALSGKNKTLAGIALLLGMTPMVINASIIYRFPPANFPAPLNCTSGSTMSANVYMAWAVAATSCTIIADALAVVVTWRKTRTATRSQRRLVTGLLQRPFLEQVMWQNGNFYFCTLTSLGVANIVLVVLSITVEPGEASYVNAFFDPIASILNSRFLLALHETNGRLQGADMCTRSSSLHFDAAGGDQRARTSDISEFLGSLGGPIHPFPDEGPELFGIAQPSRSVEPELVPDSGREMPVGGSEKLLA